MGYKKTMSIMAGGFATFALLHLVILRNTDNVVLKNVIAYLFILVFATLFVILFINRQKP